MLNRTEYKVMIHPTLEQYYYSLIINHINNSVDFTHLTEQDLRQLPINMYDLSEIAIAQALSIITFKCKNVFVQCYFYLLCTVLMFVVWS